MKLRKKEIWFGVQQTMNPQQTISDVRKVLRPAVFMAELLVAFA